MRQQLQLVTDMPEQASLHIITILPYIILALPSFRKYFCQFKIPKLFFLKISCLLSACYTLIVIVFYFFTAGNKAPNFTTAGNDTTIIIYNNKVNVYIFNATDEDDDKITYSYVLLPIKFYLKDIGHV